MKNIFTVDLEDWFCAYNHRINIKDWDKQELRVVENTRKILRLLSKHETKATFFVLGWIAEKVPSLVREVESDGHEIATHGYSHSLITQLTPEEFANDIKKALEVTASVARKQIFGYRAPSFTITKKTMWALSVLKNNGIQYDSSVFPVGFHPDYGIGDSELNIHQLDGLTELPLSVAELFGKKIPCSGGGYFRIFPYSVSKKLINSVNKQGRPVIFYIHPWEVDPGQPRRNLSFSKKFRHYYNLDSTERRLEKLLSDFEFQTIKETLNL
ncbi:MAG: XrtA system polysaccharide deacetylase [Ignavibacteriaceae bacterium]